MPEEPSYEPLRVTDMSLAATLLLHGFETYTVEKYNDDPKDGRGCWVFDDPTGDAEGVVAAYDGRNVWVDPQEFQVAVAKVRKQLFSWRDRAGFSRQRDGRA